MEPGRFLIIRNSACDQWVFYEKYRLAYSFAYERARSRANILAWGTIIFGALTTASAAFSHNDAVTVVIGIVTTIAAGLQQTFRWEEKALQYWRARAEAEQVCRALKQYLSGVALNQGASYDPLYEQRLVPPALEVSGVERYVEQAQGNLSKDSISTLVLVAAVDGIDEEGVATEEGAVGIVPLQRG